MITIYKTKEELKQLEEIEQDAWINLVDPTVEEIETVCKKTNMSQDLMLKLLDDDELPRIEIDNNTTLIVVDAPFVVANHHYVTMPLGIFISEHYLVTISLKQNEAIEDFINGSVKEFYTYMKTRFIFQLLRRICAKYINYLKKINSDIEEKENALYKATENRELVYLLNLQKSLVFFVTSLKSNDIVLEKLSKGTIMTLYQDDLDLLEDAIIENKQCIEMSNIYREILSTVSDTYATVISNNLNSVMKVLTGITIIISIPTLISSFLGMNVPLGFLATNPWSFLCIAAISFGISIIITIILKKKGLL